MNHRAYESTLCVEEKHQECMSWLMCTCPCHDPVGTK